MIPDHLLKKINSLADLPLSEELLGTYLEGNLRGSELREVQSMIGYNSALYDICNIENTLESLTDSFIGTDLSTTFELDGYNALIDPVFDQLELPVINLPETEVAVDIDSSYDTLCHDDNSIYDTNNINHLLDN